jgi:hypothetical protein
VKRLLAIGLFASGFVVAGVFSGAVIADVTTSLTTPTAPATTTGVTTATTTAVTTSTTTAVTTSTTPAKVTTPSVSATIPKGVRVAGVLVGGLKPAAAVGAVQHAFRKPLAVVVNRSRLELDPATVAAAYAATAVARARIAAPRTNVSLAVAVRGAPVRAWVAKIAQRFNSAPVDATLTFPNAHPAIRGDRAGRRLDAKLLTQRIVSTLGSNSRVDRHQPFGQPPLSLRRHEAGSRLPSRYRPVDLPDAGRALAHRRDVEEPVVVPTDAGLLGEGPQAGAARPVEPARHPLDGAERPRCRHSRHRRARVDRL